MKEGGLRGAAREADRRPRREARLTAVHRARGPLVRRESWLLQTSQLRSSLSCKSLMILGCPRWYSRSAEPGTVWEILLGVNFTRGTQRLRRLGPYAPRHGGLAGDRPPGPTRSLAARRRRRAAARRPRRAAAARCATTRAWHCRPGGVPCANSWFIQRPRGGCKCESLVEDCDEGLAGCKLRAHKLPGVHCCWQDATSLLEGWERVLVRRGTLSGNVNRVDGRVQSAARSSLKWGSTHFPFSDAFKGVLCSQLCSHVWDQGRWT